MKQRVISIIIALIIFVPIFVIGGIVFKITILILGLLGLKELLDIKGEKGKLPLLIKIISFILFGMFVLNNSDSKELLWSMDYKVLALSVIFITIPIVLYNDNEKYNINDALYLLGSIVFLGFCFNLLIIIRNFDLMYIIYLFVITTMTDTYAFIGGNLSGRHKIAPKISPKKTIEGTIIGAVFGTLIACVFYYIVIDDSILLSVLIPVTFILSCLAQFGDLIFSSIKRHFGVKDFSNIMPGHGGILDRLDSMFLVMLGFVLFIMLI